MKKLNVNKESLLNVVRVAHNKYKGLSKKGKVITWVVGLGLFGAMLPDVETTEAPVIEHAPTTEVAPQASEPVVEEVKTETVSTETAEAVKEEKVDKESIAELVDLTVNATIGKTEGLTFFETEYDSEKDRYTVKYAMKGTSLAIIMGDKADSKEVAESARNTTNKVAKNIKESFGVYDSDTNVVVVLLNDMNTDNIFLVSYNGTLIGDYIGQ